jgi:hypothetical protein
VLYAIAVRFQLVFYAIVLASGVSVAAARPICQPDLGVAVVQIWAQDCPSCLQQETLAMALRVTWGDHQRFVRLVAEPDLIADLQHTFGPCAPIARRSVWAHLRALPFAVGGPRDQARLAVVRRLARVQPYRVRATARLSVGLEQRLYRLAVRFYRRTGRRLFVTSGLRDPYRQALAMYVKLRVGGRILGLYRNRKAAKEVVFAYREMRRKGRKATVSAMKAVIEKQICSGVFLSDHLRGTALDLRSWGMRARHRRILRRELRRIFPRAF